MSELNTQTPQEFATAIFAGGCFWCMEPPFKKLAGVVSVTSGYIGGHEADATYDKICAGGTGHAEAVQIIYDPRQVTYEQLLDTYWRNVDPTVDKRQFCDVGDQYRSAIFVVDAQQRKIAEELKQKIVDSGRFSNVYTEIVDATKFYPAEDYHQDYAEKNPVSYELYRYSSGRDARLNELWGE